MNGDGRTKTSTSRPATGSADGPLPLLAEMLLPKVCSWKSPPRGRKAKEPLREQRETSGGCWALPSANVTAAGLEALEGAPPESAVAHAAVAHAADAHAAAVDATDGSLPARLRDEVRADDRAESAAREWQLYSEWHKCEVRLESAPPRERRSAQPPPAGQP